MTETLDITISKVAKSRLAETDFNNLPFGRTFSDHMFVAEYADGGFSSMNNDEMFEEDRVLNFLKYGKKKLPFKLRLSLLLKEIKKNIRYWDFPKLTKLFLQTPKIILGA